MPLHRRERRPWRWLGSVLLCAEILLHATPGLSQVLPGATVEERAINGAKEYVKNNGLKNPALTMLLSPRFKPAMLTFARQWEEHTGVKLKFVESDSMAISARLMAEAVARTGVYDLVHSTPYVVPEAARAGAIMPLDAYVARGQPDFSSLETPLRAQQTYQGTVYFFLLSSDHLMLLLRQDILDLPGVKDAFRQRYGWEPGCPESTDRWEQLAAFFHTRKGQTRWGTTFAQDLYGALAYRSAHFSSQHFPVYFPALLFDRDMQPRINTPQGIRALTAFTSIVQYMPPDIQRWGTPQIYPFWASGQAFSVLALPSLVAFANSSAESKVKGQQLSCVIPGVQVDGQLVRHAPQAAGTGYMVSRASKHPELAYYFLQWLTGPTKGDEAIAHPQGFWGPLRPSHRTNEAILAKFGAPFVEVTLENARYATSLLMLPEHHAYNQVFDTNAALVLQGSATPAEAAGKIEEGWNTITEAVGRSEQSTVWRSGVESGLYGDKF